jgi:hypothetical protein
MQIGESYSQLKFVADPLTEACDKGDAYLKRYTQAVLDLETF